MKQISEQQISFFTISYFHSNLISSFDLTKINLVIEKIFIRKKRIENNIIEYNNKHNNINTLYCESKYLQKKSGIINWSIKIHMHDVWNIVCSFINEPNRFYHNARMQRVTSVDAAMLHTLLLVANNESSLFGDSLFLTIPIPYTVAPKFNAGHKGFRLWTGWIFSCACPPTINDRLWVWQRTVIIISRYKRWLLARDDLIIWR